MPATRTYKTPGVYVAELSSFPPSVVGVQTAIPCFVGYTQKAEVGGKPVLLKPVAITSLAEFEQFFGGAHHALYAIKDVGTPVGDDYDFRVQVNGSSPPTYTYYKLGAESSSFNLYYSMRLFYANGGANCYVVSAGLYESVDNATGVVTPNSVTKDNLSAALNAAAEQVGPTMLVCPDAVLLPPNAPAQGKNAEPWVSADFADISKQMILQAQALQDRVAVLDVYGTQYLGKPAADAKTDVPTLDQVITQFRADVGSEGLSYGMAYFPFVDTSVVPATSVDYTNLDNADPNGGTGPLQAILSTENTNLYGTTPRHDAVQADIDAISTTTDPVAVRKLNDNLTAAIPLLGEMLAVVINKEDLLPPSGAMAGVMTYVDQNRGVWNAPANVTLAGVVRPSFLLNSAQQGDLNLPVDGKAVDALREFPGRGTVVWGARTLDGNSNDYRYVQVRRTLIYIEQSVKNALNQFVFAPNTGQTWATVVSMVSAFLTTVWNQGGLMGATASDAFSVECGLGSTMTGKDVLEGYMIVQVTLQLIRPAEFIELTFKQKMEGVA